MKKRNWGTGRGAWTRELSDSASVSDHVSRKHPQRKTGRQQFITGEKRPRIPCPLKTPSESAGKLRSFLAMTLSYFLSAGHPCFLSENFPHFLSAYLFYFLWGKTLLLINELPQHPLRGSPLLPVRESPLLPVQCLPFFQSVDFLYFTSSDPFYFLWAGPSYFPIRISTAVYFPVRGPSLFPVIRLPPLPVKSLLYFLSAGLCLTTEDLLFKQWQRQSKFSRDRNYNVGQNAHLKRKD